MLRQIEREFLDCEGRKREKKGGREIERRRRERDRERRKEGER